VTNGGSQSRRTLVSITDCPARRGSASPKGSEALLLLFWKRCKWLVDPQVGGWRTRKSGHSSILPEATGP
jgi:hypothetical protein